MKPVAFLALLCFFSPNELLAQFTNELRIPDTLSGSAFELTVAPSATAFLPGDSTATYGINSNYLAPTLIFQSGDSILLSVENLLDDSTTMHWHGMHVSPMNDGGPHTAIAPGAIWEPSFLVRDEATTFWYHPHLHHKTAEQVYMGAAGMIIVRSEAEAQLDLPRTYGVDDIPMIIQDKSFDENNALIFTAMADTMMVNGTLNPYLEVPAQRVRFRLLNASNQRVYNVLFPPNTNPRVIGSDGGLLNSPAPLSSVILTPGERFEIVADFTNFQDSTLLIYCDNSDLPVGASGGPGGASGPPGNGLDSNDFELMELRVTAPTAHASGPLPDSLNANVLWNEEDAAATRIKVFDTLNAPFPYYINGTPFNHHQINDTTFLDDVEIWELRNETDIAHPFHIHDVQFFILSVNGNDPPLHLRGKKDVVFVNVGDTIRFITKFETFTDSVVPYMYHCHNLFHEDAGMMGQFLVLNRPVGVSAAERTSTSWWPNPTGDILTFGRIGDAAPARTQVLDIMGRVLSSSSNQREVSLINFLPGVYFIQYAKASGKVFVDRVVKH